MSNSRYSHNHFHNQRSSFFPMLCRSSIKDIKLPIWQNSNSSSSIVVDVPSSPKVSCMGQVKRNNKVIGFPTSYVFTTTKANRHHIKYRKLKKLFSGRNLTDTIAAAPATITSTITTSIHCSGKSREKSIKAARRSYNCNEHHHHDNHIPININELDPPLPVIKRMQQNAGSRDEVNLWKRRSGRTALRSLEIQPIQIPNNHQCLPPTTSNCTCMTRVSYSNLEF